MKTVKQTILTLIAGVLCLGLSACRGSTGLKYKSGEKVFYYSRERASLYYDLSEETYNVNLVLDKEGSVTSIKFGRVEADKKQFGYNSGILTVAGEVFAKQSSGEKDMVVTFKDGSSVRVTTLICDKVIKTAQDLQDISKNLDGTYVLANDIDCSSIANFEPLGRYVTETDTSNHYFHGILEGNGYSIKNLKAYYSSNPAHATSTGTYVSNFDVYDDDPMFKESSHIPGDNIGVFQTIGSSGIVRNIVFDNVRVRGRTIVGVIAGNNMGLVENCLIKENCRAEMNTHFYDNDCNVGAAFGIVAGSGRVYNCVSLTSKVSISEIFTDWDTTYSGKTGNGWDHVATEGNTDCWWHYCGVDRERQIYPEDQNENPVSSGEKEIDSNGKHTNGVYAFVGKCWGEVNNSLALKFSQHIFVSEGSYEDRDVEFGQTHKGENKPWSGGTDLGQITNCSTLSLSQLQVASNYTGFDSSVWNIVDGNLPTLKTNIIAAKLIA